jgi:predicted transcriptional regulator of viral defense system
MNTYTSLHQVEQLLKNKNLKVVTAEILKVLFPDKSNNTRQSLLKRLHQQGRVNRLKRGLYEINSNPLSVFEKANLLYRPSYISLETALNYYGILPQFPQVITSVTTQHSNQFTADQQFEYSRIKPDLFHGYHQDQDYLIATPEKALADIAYFADKGLRRFHPEEFDLTQINMDELHQQYPWTKAYVR